MGLSLCVAAVIAVIGFGLTAWMSDRLRFEERVAAGVVVALDRPEQVERAVRRPFVDQDHRDTIVRGQQLDLIDTQP